MADHSKNDKLQCSHTNKEALEPDAIKQNPKKDKLQRRYAKAGARGLDAIKPTPLPEPPSRTLKPISSNVPNMKIRQRPASSNSEPTLEPITNVSLPIRPLVQQPPLRPTRKYTLPAKSTRRKAKRANNCYNCGSSNHHAIHCASEFRCFKCNKTGHLKADCPDKSSTDPVPEVETTCYNCGSDDHRSKHCTSEKRCFKCNKTGHRKVNCPDKSSADSISEVEMACYNCGSDDHHTKHCTSEQRCFKCNKTGHIMVDCADESSEDPITEVEMAIRTSGQQQGGLYYEHLTWIEMMASVMVIDNLTFENVEEMFESTFGWSLPQEWRRISQVMKDHMEAKRGLIELPPLPLGRL